MNLNEPKWLITVILTLHITSVRAEVLRVLSVGTGGSSSSSAADLLSGGKASAQQHREMEKTPVMADESRPMMLVTGPNLCEEDADPQSFSSALLLSSPGPHAVLMLLHLEDPPAGQCDSVRQAQELLGAEVLQFCIVLLLQNQQEPFTGASRGIAGEMIRACGGRFHIISDSQPKPAQTAALVAEIEKMVWLNGGKFYSVSTQELKTEVKQEFKTELTSQDVNEQNKVKSVMYNMFAGTVGIIGWILLISLHVFAIHSKGNEQILFEYGAKFASLTLFLIYIRHFLPPYIAIPLNLALISSPAIKFKTKNSNFNISDIKQSIEDHFVLQWIEKMSVLFIPSFAPVIGSMVSIWTWSDVLTACFAATAVTWVTFVLKDDNSNSQESPNNTLRLFLFSFFAGLFSVGFLNLCFLLFGVSLTLILITLGITVVCLLLKSISPEAFKVFIVLMFLPCVAVLIGSGFLILGTIMSFLKLIIVTLLSSYLFYIALLSGSLIVLYQRQTASTDVTNPK